MPEPAPLFSSPSCPDIHRNSAQVSVWFVTGAAFPKHFKLHLRPSGRIWYSSILPICVSYPPHLWTSRKDAHLTWLYLSNMQIKPNSVMFINFRLSSSNNDIWPLSRRPRVKTDFSSLHCSPTWCTDCSLSLVPILILFRGYIEYKFVCVIFLSLISQKIFQKFQATRLPLIRANCSLCQTWMQDIYFHLLAISRCVNFFENFVETVI